MRFGKRGMSGESKTVVAILMVFGVLFMISFVWSFFSQGGGPPTGPDAVIKYYDDLLKGEYGGKKYSPTSLVIVLFVPLITSFSLIWTLARILPVFRIRENRQAAAVLAMGLSIYVVPTMSWMILQVFPPLLGVSAILIGVAMLLMAVFVLVSTTYQFGGLKWGGGGGGGGGGGDEGGGGGGGGWNLFGRGDRSGGDDEEHAAGVRLQEDMGRLINGFEEGLNSKTWKDIVESLEKNKDIKNLTNEQKDILFKKFGRWLEYYRRQFLGARSKLKPGCGLDQRDRIELDTAIELVEQQAVDLLGKLRGIEGGGYVTTSGELLSKIYEIKRSGKALKQRYLGVKTRTSKPKTGPKKDLSDEDANNAENLRDLLERHIKGLEVYLKAITDHIDSKIRKKEPMQAVEYEIVNDYKDFKKVFMSGRNNLNAIVQTFEAFKNSLISPKPAFYGPAGIYSDLDKFIDKIKPKLNNLPTDNKPGDFNEFIGLLDQIKVDVFNIRKLIDKYSK